MAMLLPFGLLLCSGFVASQDVVAPSFYPCPFLGPSYAKPANLINDPIIKAAADNITAVLAGALSTGLLDNQTTAFSLTAFSTSDQHANPFYTFHQTPPALAQAELGVTKVTSDTVYRLGSLSKVITVYTLLVADGFKHFQDPISSFLPNHTQDQSESRWLQTILSPSQTGRKSLYKRWRAIWEALAWSVSCQQFSGALVLTLWSRWRPRYRQVALPLY